MSDKTAIVVLDSLPPATTVEEAVEGTIELGQWYWVKRDTTYEDDVYRRRLERKRLMGKNVRLREDVTTTVGKVYEAGSLWRVTSSDNSGGLTIYPLTAQGEEMPDGRYLNRVQPRDLILDVAWLSQSHLAVLFSVPTVLCSCWAVWFEAQPQMRAVTAAMASWAVMNTLWMLHDLSVYQGLPGAYVAFGVEVLCLVTAAALSGTLRTGLAKHFHRFRR